MSWNQDEENYYQFTQSEVSGICATLAENIVFHGNLILKIIDVRLLERTNETSPIEKKWKS